MWIMKRIDEIKLKRINKLALAFAIAFMPPIWAVLSPYVGIQTGAVALIVAGLYVTNGNEKKDAVRWAFCWGISFRLRQYG